MDYLNLFEDNSKEENSLWWINNNRNEVIEQFYLEGKSNRMVISIIFTGNTPWKNPECFELNIKEISFLSEEGATRGFQISWA